MWNQKVFYLFMATSLIRLSGCQVEKSSTQPRRSLQFSHSNASDSPMTMSYWRVFYSDMAVSLIWLWWSRVGKCSTLLWWSLWSGCCDVSDSTMTKLSWKASDSAMTTSLIRHDEAQSRKLWLGCDILPIRPWRRQVNESSMWPQQCLRFVRDKSES